MKSNYKSYKKQKGVALFVTLLVVTIATLLATEIWYNNTLDVSRQYNNRSSYQANHYAKGMMLWAFDVLKLDFEKDSNFDNHGDAWNQTIAGIELEDAVLSGKLVDMDGKFNLNNLIISGIENQQSIGFLKRILVNLELDVGLADKILDWLDADQIPRPLGAEDSTYLSKRPSYRTSGQHFVHISELKLIDGIDEKTYQRLKSFLSVLPILGNYATKLNINTAPTLLLKSLDDRITTKDALILFADGFAVNKTLAEFFRQPAIQYHNLNRQELSNIITTKSQWFQAQIFIKMEQTIFQKFALVYRSSAVASVRQWSETEFN